MKLAWIVLTVAVVSDAGPQGQCAAPASAPPAAADVWLISTRDLPCAACSTDAQPDFWRLSAAAQWIAADRREFLAADRAAVPTVFWIHGNRYTADEAVEDGLAFCGQLKGLAPGARFRYVIWSWPSDRISLRNRPDVKSKNVRSRHEAVYLARLLDRVDPRVPVSLIGFSYGAQTVVGACELLAGGCYAGCRLEHRGPPRQAPLRAVLIAAATEDNALASADGEPSPLGPVDRLLVTCNDRDVILRYYPRIYRPRGPAALGFAGPQGLDPADPNSKKIEILDLACYVERHDWDIYRQACPLCERLAWYTQLTK